MTKNDLLAQFAGYKDAYDEYLHIKEQTDIIKAQTERIKKETEKIKKDTKTMTIVGSILITLEVILFIILLIIVF